MRLSEARISHLAHRMLDRLWRDDLIEFEDEAAARRVLKETLGRLMAVDEEVDLGVREMLRRQRKVPGSREWQVLYDQYFRAEMEKRRW